MKLFEPLDVAGLRLPNRIVMAPMTRSRVGPGDAPTSMNARYYAQRASSGLIISEAITVEPRGRGYLHTPGLYTEAQIQGWREVTAAVHDHGGRIFAQLWHVGRVSHASVLPDKAKPLGPTGESVPCLTTFALREDGTPGAVPVTPPQAMDAVQLKSTVDHFARAAQDALAAGFDGIEILAANGYLFDQFQNSVVNTRTDDYGGHSPGTRARLLLETLDAIGERIDATRIGIRLSPFGRFNEMPFDPHTAVTYLHIARELARRKVAYCHFNDEPVSPGHLNADGAGPGDVPRRLIPMDFYRDFRDFFHGTVIICGGMNAELAENFLQLEVAELIAFGLHYIANPDLPERLRNKWPFSEPDTKLFYGGDFRGYIDYPPYTLRGVRSSPKS